MSVSKKSDGRWCVIEYVDGKQRWKYFGRGVEAEKQARDHDASLKDSGQVREYKKRARTFGPTVTELAEAYLTSKATTLPAASINAMTYKFTAVILPEVGHLKAMRLTAEALDKYVAKRAQAAKMTTIHRELSDLQACLNWSVKRRLIPSNPVSGYAKPRRDDEVIRPPSEAEVKALLAHAPDHMKRALTIASYVGLRPGKAELFRLTWNDVDLAAGIIHVTSAQKGGLRHRSVPIHTALLKALVKWHADDGGKGYLIHYNDKSISSLKHSWANTKRRAGITRRLRPYDCRHFFATMMLAAGGDLKSTSEMLGHSRPDTTVRVYQHTDALMHRANIDRLPDMLTNE